MEIGKYHQNSHRLLGHFNLSVRKQKMNFIKNSRQFHKSLAPWVSPRYSFQL